MQYAALTIRCLLGVVLFTAFFTKVAGPGRFTAFSASLTALRVVPRAISHHTALAVVSAESAACALLLGPGGIAVAGLVLAGVLLAGFGVVLTSLTRRGTKAPCPCFGTSGVELGAWHVVRNFALAAAAGAGAVATAAPAPVRLGGAVPAIVAGAVLGALVVRAEDIAGLFRPTHKT